MKFHKSAASGERTAGLIKDKKLFLRISVGPATVPTGIGGHGGPPYVYTVPFWRSFKKGSGFTVFSADT